MYRTHTCGELRIDHLHGGPDRFQNKVWESREQNDGVEFLYYSEDGEMGYLSGIFAFWLQELLIF